MSLQHAHAALARALKEDPKIVTRLRQGVIVSVDPSTFTCSVNLAGDTVNTIAGVSFLRGGYLPTVNDTVWVAQTSTDLLVIGGHASGYGTVTWIEGTTSTNTTTTAAGAEILDAGTFFTVPVIQGLKYMVILDGRIDVGLAGTAWAQRLRMSAISGSPSNPTTASTQFGGSTGYNAQAGGGGEMPVHGVGYFTAASTGSTIVGASVLRIAGGGEVSLRAPEAATPITINAYCLGIP